MSTFLPLTSHEPIPPTTFLLVGEHFRGVSELVSPRSPALIPPRLFVLRLRGKNLCAFPMYLEERSGDGRATISRI
jgi:hypothetical protein